MKRPFLALNARHSVVVAATVLLSACAGPPSSRASADSLFLSTQDGRARLVDGANVVGTAEDTLAVVEVKQGHMLLRHQVSMPTSLVGPPSSIAIAPDGQWALVSAATRRDPTDAGKVTGYDRVSIVALDPSGAAAPRVVGSLQVGPGASGISIHPSGKLALVANRLEGSVALLSIQDHQLEIVDKVSLGVNSGPAHAAFTPDGRRALVTRDGDNRISLLHINDKKITLDKRDITAGLRPYGLDISSDGAYAAVTNLGAGTGDLDTISLIDMQHQPPRTVDTVTVGQTPEGVVFAPDGRTLGVSVIDGSNKPQASPFFGQASYLQFRVESSRLVPTVRVVGGQWLQGHAFSADGNDVLLQDALNRQIRLYRKEADTLVDTGQRLQFDAAPSTIRRWK